MRRARYSGPLPIFEPHLHMLLLLGAVRVLCSVLLKLLFTAEMRTIAIKAYKTLPLLSRTHGGVADRKLWDIGASWQGSYLNLLLFIKSVHRFRLKNLEKPL